MRRITFGTAMLVSCVAVFAGSAVASPPLKTPLNNTINREVAGICAFPIRIQGTQTGQQIDFFDADGQLVRRHRHGVEAVTLTANGQTLTADPFHFNIIIHFGPTGAVEHAYLSGLVFRVPLPDGTMFQSAGRLDFIAQGVNFAVIPEVGASGDVGALCDALSGVRVRRSEQPRNPRGLSLSHRYRDHRNRPCWRGADDPGPRIAAP